MISNSTTTGIEPAGKCGYCGMLHGPVCPSVKAFEYHPDGTVKRVEFFAPNDYAPVLSAGPLVTDYRGDPRFTAAAPAYFGAWHGHVLAGCGDGNGAYRWSDADGWQRLDGGATNIPRN